LTPTVVVALVLLAVAAGAVAAGLFADAADDWMPEVATSAVFVAITITLIERAARREERHPPGPRLRRLHQDHNGVLGWFAWAVAQEYGDTHDRTFRPLPQPEVGRIFQHWIDGAEDVDLPPSQDRIEPGAETLAKALDELRVGNLDLLGPEADFVIEMDD